MLAHVTDGLSTSDKYASIQNIVKQKDTLNSGIFCIAFVESILGLSQMDASDSNIIKLRSRIFREMNGDQLIRTTRSRAKKINK
jgi:hypothetical protein